MAAYETSGWERRMFSYTCEVNVARACGGSSAAQIWLLRCKASKPWGRFCIIDKDCVAYNRAGMRAEDPTADTWSASKLWIDNTPFVKRLDWMEALKERIIRMTKIFDNFSESTRKNNPPRQEYAQAAAVEAPAAARATKLKERGAMTTPLVQTVAFGIGM